MSLLSVERPSPAVALLRIVRPDARNALNMQLRRELSQTFDHLSTDEHIRAVVMTGSEQVFMAGADLKEIAQDSSVDMASRNALQLWKSISGFPKPIIAAVNGLAYGAGLELALHADIIVAGRSAKFAHPEVKLGLIPGGGGTQRLVRAIGKYQTMLLVLTGEIVDAEQAFRMGFLSELVEDSSVLARALEIAELITKRPAIAVRLAKEAVLSGADMPLSAGLLLERRLFESTFATQDQKEGVSAFFEKREPVFRGR